VETTKKTAPGADKGRWEKIQFTGRGGEYFKIWIVNVFLSILTLGIYSAWAKVRSWRYFYGNTWLDGSAFEYHASPVAILKGRLIAVAVLVLVLVLGQLSPLADVASFIVLALLTPLVVWRSIIFTAKMSSYRNVRFGFSGKVGPLYRYLLLLPLLPILIAAGVIAMQYAMGSIDFSDMQGGAEGGPAPAGAASLGITFGIAILATYLLLPYIQKAITAYYLNGHRYGQGKFRAKLGAGKYYLIYLVLFGLSLLVYLLLVALIVGVYFMFNEQLSGVMQQAQAGASPAAAAVIVPLVIIPLVLIGIWFKAYLVTRLRNYSLSQIRLDKTIALRSRIRVNRLFWIQFSNVLLLIVTLGLAYPWTMIRVTRYKMQTLYAHVYGDLDQYVSQMQARQSALGEEMGEAFDLDLDLGI